MLFVSDFTITPTKQLEYFDGIIPLNADRVALVSSKLDGSSSNISVYHRDGRLLKDIEIPGGELKNGNYGTLNKEEIFYLIPWASEWAIFNPETGQHRKGKFDCLTPSGISSRVIFLTEFKAICIYETGTFREKKGRATFLSYPPDKPSAEPWIVPIERSFNVNATPLGTSGRIATFYSNVYYNRPSVNVNIKALEWTVHDYSKRTSTDHSVEFGDGTPSPLKNVYEVSHNNFLLVVETDKIERKHMFYDAEQKKLTPFKAALTQLKGANLFMIGVWLYYIGSENTPEGKQPSPTWVISKQGDEVTFKDIIPNKQHFYYYPGTLMDQFIIGVNGVCVRPNRIDIQYIRATSQRELYVHIMKELTSQKMTTEMLQSILDQYEWQE